MDYNDSNIASKSTKAIVTNQANKKNNNLAVTSLVLGIMSLMLCWLFVCPIILGLIGIVIGIISLIKKRDGAKLAIAGTILSVIGLLLGILFLLFYIIGIFINY